MRLAAERCSSSRPAAIPIATSASTRSRRNASPTSSTRPERRAQLAAALDELPADGLPAVNAAVESLRADPGLAWRSFALSLLADELADE